MSTMDAQIRDPQTPSEWQIAVAMAQACLLLDAARQYGLVTGGPAVAVERCVDILERGASMGYEPTQGEIDACIEAIAHG